MVTQGRTLPLNVEITGTYNDRFLLRYNANALSIIEVPETQETFAYIKDRRLHIQSAGMISKVQVYDLSGKLVMDYKPESSVTRIETDFNFARGAYITLITLENNITVSKKLMN